MAVLITISGVSRTELRRAQLMTSGRKHTQGAPGSRYTLYTAPQPRVICSLWGDFDKGGKPEYPEKNHLIRLNEITETQLAHDRGEERHGLEPIRQPDSQSAQERVSPG